jgi:molecular chaperone GrpE
MEESQDTKTPPVEPDVNERITELEKQLKRVAADFDNYRKRTESEKKLSFQLAQAQTLLELAPVLDNFRRATTHLPDTLRDDKWVTGVLYIEKQLEQIFSEFGVEKIKTVGEAFNPELHEAVSHDPSDSIPENEIITEVESGYMLQGQVLKPAKVKVSRGPSA